MPGSDLSVEEVTTVTDEIVGAFARLLPQLSRSAPAISAAELAAIVASPTTIVLVARDAGQAIVGTLTLVVFRIPTGVRAWIEDVVVDRAAARRGVGTALTRAAIERANQAGARTVDLTSRPSRVAANGLYQKLGFALRETNVYRHG